MSSKSRRRRPPQSPRYACQRCKRRYRGHGDWNEDRIASLVIGYLCPDCQTVEEDLEAQIAEVLNHPSGWRVVAPPDGTDADGDRYLTEVVDGLVKAYPTSKVMRDKADQLEAVRKDRQAASMVKLMRATADEMESGALWQ
jgi:hypothetical protein